jgi:outer membrane protein OmpA-like peptidoglycan-associated protein
MFRFFTHFFFIFCLFSHPILAQKEAYIWYFGKNAGVDFRSGAAVALTDGILNTEEGVATICDKQGNLLFYTDGISVWNRQHKIMTNGSNLKGHPSSTQSGVVIPKPQSPNLYYLFTVDATAGPNGLRYSLVDMSLADGLGDIQIKEKDISLQTPVTEKLTAVKHRNGTDSWVIAHGWQNNEFYAYLVTAQGIKTPPVISQVGSIHQGGTLNTQGYLKSNPDGTNLALALEEQHQIELFDFDNSNGKVSNPLNIQMPAQAYSYGIEFSPSGSILYASAAGLGKVYQYNLQAGSNEKIIASGIEVGKTNNNVWVGALQIAPDGKIYFPIYNTSFLGVIKKPNLLGLECGYANDYVNLGKGIAQLGLPTFNQSSFNQEINVKINYFDDKNIKIGENLVLKNINFEYAKYNLLPISFAELDKLANYLKNNPGITVHLLGHTDNIGNKSANLELSLNRAQSVKEYLKNKGINENRVTFTGLGSSQPIATNNTEGGRARNRRVEVILKK